MDRKKLAIIVLLVVLFALNHHLSKGIIRDDVVVKSSPVDLSQSTIRDEVVVRSSPVDLSQSTIRDELVVKSSPVDLSQSPFRDELVVKSSLQLTSDGCPTPPCYVFHPERFLQQHPSYLALYRSESNQTRTIQVRKKIEKGRLLSPRLLVFEQQHIYCHVHKNGGTALYEATQDTPGRVLLYNWQEKKWGSERFDQEVARVQNLPNVTYFSFLRDPVSRYLSAVRQVLVKNQRKVSLEGDFAGCTEDNLVECALDRMEHSFLNPHFLPQVLELRHCVPAQGDASIMLTDMANLNAYVGGVIKVDMGPAPNVTKKEPPSQDLVDRICQRYAMDVELIRSVGSIDSPCLK